VSVEDRFTESCEVEAGVSRVSIDELIGEKDAAAFFRLEEFVAIERELWKLRLHRVQRGCDA